jgi:sugar phosphate isomerase/epimerase
MSPLALPLGICLSPERAAELAPGYDFVELGVSTLLPFEPDDAWAARQAELAALRPPVRAFNVFVPGQLPLVGPNVDRSAIAVYVGQAVARAAELGAGVIVFGSGRARAVPEGFARTRAQDQLADFLTTCADAAAGTGVTIAIEPLNHAESNILTTYLEAAELAARVARPEIRVLADVYHFMMDEEPLDDILRAPERLAHIHLADSERLYPGSGSYPLARLFAILREVGYQGALSIECRWGDDFAAESAAALAYLRGLMAV